MRHLALLVTFFLIGVSASAQENRPASQSEVDQLREEVHQLKAGMEQLRTLFEAKGKPPESAPATPPEANLLNGMQALDADGNPTPFSRLLGQASASEPGLIAFQATNRHKAVSGRIGFSPILGLEIGTSVYNGRINLLGESPRSVTMLFYDGSYRRGSWAFDAQYARINIVGGIPRQSPPPPVLDPSNAGRPL